ncbi:putative E3 ubiquitin-protein ligase XBAT31 [Camellia lanceoleosa]|nr:putative E3 ubiquitin-protein ligase XBAT31 [Camellia lanceoleosa]
MLLDSGALVCAFTRGYGRIPYMVALRHKHAACAALLNPSAPDPLIWPSSLKFITELNSEAKALLERVLMETNKEREKTILKATVYSLPSPLHYEAEASDNMSEATNSGPGQ